MRNPKLNERPDPDAFSLTGAGPLLGELVEQHPQAAKMHDLQRR